MALHAYRRLRTAFPRRLRFTLDRVDSLHLAAGLLQRWLEPDRLFVGWILCGDEDTGSTRVRGLMPHAYLCSRGVNSVILRKPRRPWMALDLPHEDMDRIVQAEFDVVIFQGVHDAGAEELARALREAGTRTVFAATELARGSRMPEVVDWIVVASEGLRALAEDRPGRVEVIESAIDAPPGLVKDFAEPPTRDEIRVVWVGYPENIRLLAPIRQALKDPRLARYRLVTISRGPGVTYQWDCSRVHRQLIDCDIAVLPSSSEERYATKPNTRMTMFKALGLPIVASPVASYVATLTHGRSCYFARDVAEWVSCLLALEDPVHRRAIGLTDRERILAAYSPEAIGGRWLALLERLTGRCVSVPTRLKTSRS